MYSQQVSSKIGTTTKLGELLFEWTLEEQNSGGTPAINYTSEEYLKNADAGLQRTYKDLGMDSLKLNGQYAFHSIPAFIQGADETEQYYFHPDHLGSSNYITNITGIVTQHMEYFAFGETFVEEHKNSHNSPYKYNGKELDEETGWYYYGARYYDARMSLWLSVDPYQYDGTYLAGKHNAGYKNNFNQNSFIYCYQNPIVLIDPDGRQTVNNGTAPPPILVAFEGGTDDATERPVTPTNNPTGTTGQLIMNAQSANKNVLGKVYSPGIGFNNKNAVNLAFNFIVANYKKGTTLIIYGYSAGGVRALQLMNKLNKEKPDIKISLLIICDAQYAFKLSFTYNFDSKIKSNVLQAKNEYETQHGGEPLTGTNGNLTNINVPEMPSIDKEDMDLVTHRRIDEVSFDYNSSIINRKLGSSEPIGTFKVKQFMRDDEKKKKDESSCD